ncbi:MAG: hypothetical protein JXB38_15565 [Anaerolineales bacterium]|nr:hypothetical protein [Anaerolineales bacterium]
MNTTPPTSPPPPTETTIPSDTPVPEPIYLSGEGDAIVELDKPAGPMLVQITGNAAGEAFKIVHRNETNRPIGILVDTDQPYEGVRLIDYFPYHHTTQFVVTATGAWEIAVLPLTEARRLQVPGTISGSTDDVFVLAGATPNLAVIERRFPQGRFSAITYGDSRRLLVDTQQVYTDSVILDRSAWIVEIIAAGEWVIEISAVE